MYVDQFHASRNRDFNGHTAVEYCCIFCVGVPADTENDRLARLPHNVWLMNLPSSSGRRRGRPLRVDCVIIRNGAGGVTFLVVCESVNLTPLVQIINPCQRGYRVYVIAL